MEEASQPDAKATGLAGGIVKEEQALVDNGWNLKGETDCWGLRIKPAQPPAGETFDLVLKRYNEVEEKFLDSQTWIRLQRIVQDNVSRPTQIDNALCVALGSLSAVGQCRGNLDDRTSSLFQLAAFIAVIAELQTKVFEAHGKAAHLQEQGVVKPQDRPQVKISMTAQEPRFNDLDKQLLKHLGIRVVAEPEMWSLIDERSMVYIPGAEANHFMIVSRKKPAMWWPISSKYLKYVEK